MIVRVYLQLVAVFFFCQWWWLCKASFEIVDGESILNISLNSPILLDIQILTADAHQNFIFNDTLVNPYACIIVDGSVCDCYEGNLQNIAPTLKSGCFHAIQSKLQLRNYDEDGLYLSLGLYSANQMQISSLPHFVPFSSGGNNFVNMGGISPSASEKRAGGQHENKITLVLPLVLEDLSRATLLISSLRSAPAEKISELIVITPPSHQDLVCGALQGLLQSFSVSFPLLCISEGKLFAAHPQVAYDGYAVQMAVKLLVAKIVRTNFYLTLDADILCLHPSMLNYVITRSTVHGPEEKKSYQRSVYHFESMNVHPSWWEGSAAMLQFDLALHPDIESIGFGVTPALLSTYGSLLTVGEIMRQMYVKRYGTDVLHDLSSRDVDIWPIFKEGEGIHNWILSLGRPSLWSEYTLYRLALEKYNVFHYFHVTEQMSTYPGPGVQLHCNNVWYAEQWPWDAAAAYANEQCLFSVIQSTSNIRPSSILKLMR